MNGDIFSNLRGVAGDMRAMAPADPSKLVLDPKSGLYFDPTTQNYYQRGQDGSFSVMRDPNVGAAVASFYGAGNKNAAEAAPYEQNFNDIFGRQTALGDTLKGTIENPNAPSVAREQLAQTLQGNEATQLSQAAGMGGGNAFMARRNAANNVAALNSGAGQDAALLRANEVAHAQDALGTLYSVQSDEASKLYGAKTGYGLDYSKLGAATKAGDLTNQTQQRGQDIDIAGKVATGAGSAGSAAITASDPDLKSDIHEESPANIRKFLSALEPDGFRYKDDGPDDPERHGIMTTDLKKSEIGRSLVRETPEGEGFDQGQSIGALFQALADMHRRMNRVEGRRG